MDPRILFSIITCKDHHSFAAATVPTLITQPRANGLGVTMFREAKGKPQLKSATGLAANIFHLVSRKAAATLPSV